MPRFVAALALLITYPLWAQQITIDFDPAKTEIHWSLTGNVHTTHGTFRFKQGRITFDPATGAISGELVADAASGESGNGARDKRMNKEILESAQYPEFRFRPQKWMAPFKQAITQWFRSAARFWFMARHTTSPSRWKSPSWTAA